MKLRMRHMKKDSAYLGSALRDKAASPSDLDKRWLNQNYRYGSVCTKQYQILDDLYFFCSGLEGKKPSRMLKTYPFLRVWERETLGVASSSGSS